MRYLSQVTHGGPFGCTWASVPSVWGPMVGDSHGPGLKSRTCGARRALPSLGLRVLIPIMEPSGLRPELQGPRGNSGPPRRLKYRGLRILQRIHAVLPSGQGWMTGQVRVKEDFLCPESGSRPQAARQRPRHSQVGGGGESGSKQIRVGRAHLDTPGR